LFNFFRRKEEDIGTIIDEIIENRSEDPSTPCMMLSPGSSIPIAELSEEKVKEEVEEEIPVSELIEPYCPKFEEKKKRGWMKTGIPGFDKLIKNGIPEGSNIIIAGGPGSGKTLFCLHTVYNLAAEGNDCVYLSMEEKPDRLMDHLLSFGFKVEETGRTEYDLYLRANGKGRIVIKRIQPVQLAKSVEALLEEARGTLPIRVDMILDFIPRGFNPYLLVLDSVSAVETAFSGTRRQYRIYIEQLFRYFERFDVTTFIISETLEAPRKFSVTGVEEFLADGIVVFYNLPGHTERVRGVEVYKLRGTSHVRRIVPMEITDKGIVVYPDAPPLKMTT